MNVYGFTALDIWFEQHLEEKATAYPYALMLLFYQNSYPIFKLFTQCNYFAGLASNL